MTVEQFIADLDELVDVVRKRFGKDKAAIYGHPLGFRARRALYRTLPGQGFSLCWRSTGLNEKTGISADISQKRRERRNVLHEQEP